MDDVQGVIERAWEERDAINSATRGEIRDAVDHALAALDGGSVRVAEKRDGDWHTNQWLKKAAGHNGGTRCLRNSRAGARTASRRQDFAPFPARWSGTRPILLQA